MFRIGYGNDIHRLEPGRELIIGGVLIDSDKGAIGHSDGDVLLHAATDAVLGALGLGDIGSYFPSSDGRWENAESMVFLRYAVGMMKERGYAVSNFDSVINLESPKLGPSIGKIRENLVNVFDVDADRVSIKAKTADGTGAVGAGDAISAEAVILLMHTAKRI